MAERSGTLRCTAVALLAAWVAMVFGTSALLVLAGLAGTGAHGLSGFVRATWHAADEVGPAAKLLMIAIFAVLVLAAERLAGTRARRQRYAATLGAGIAAVLLTLALIPAPLSRGFGVGLTGARLDPPALALYVAGGVLGGIAFTFSAERCRRKRLGTLGG